MFLILSRLEKGLRMWWLRSWLDDWLLALRRATGETIRPPLDFVNMETKKR
jgi:hypothetical protein